MERPRWSLKNTRDAFKAQLIQVLLQSDQFRDRAEIKAYVEKLLLAAPPGLNWAGLYQYIQKEFIVFDAGAAATDSAEMMRPLKEVDKEYKGTFLQERRELFYSRMAAKGYIPVIVNPITKRLEPLFSSIMPVVEGGMGTESSSPSPKVKELTKRVKADYINENRLNEEGVAAGHIEEFMKISTKVAVIAIRRNLCPRAAPDVSILQSYIELK